MSRYSRYGRRRVRPRRRLKRFFPYIVAVTALFFMLLTLYVSVPISGTPLEYSVDGLRVVNTTLYRVAYFAPLTEFNRTIRLYLNNISIDFDIPESNEDKVIVLGDSRLVGVREGVVQTKIVISSHGVDTAYPGPLINTNPIGRSEDYILSHFPVELYFIFTVQLCNVTINVSTRSPNVHVDRLRVIYLDREDAVPNEVVVTCQQGWCRAYLGPGCLLSYNIESDLSYLGFIRLRFEDGKALLRLVDNIWLPALFFLITVAVMYVLYWRYLSSKRYIPKPPLPRNLHHSL